MVKLKSFQRTEFWLRVYRWYSLYWVTMHKQLNARWSVWRLNYLISMFVTFKMQGTSRLATACTCTHFCGYQLEVVNNFEYLGILIINDGRVEGKVTLRIAKVRVAFANLGHFWSSHDIGLTLKGRMYNGTVYSVLLYGLIPGLSPLKMVDDFCVRSPLSPKHCWCLVGTLGEQWRGVPSNVRCRQPCSGCYNSFTSSSVAWARITFVWRSSTSSWSLYTCRARLESDAGVRLSVGLEVRKY